MPRDLDSISHSMPRAMVMGALLGMAAACSSDTGVAPAVRSPATTLAAVTVSPLNAIMAVGDTLTLTMHGTSLTQAAIADYDSVTYSLQNTVDSLRVRLSATGVLIADDVSPQNSPVLVNVIAFKDGIAAADQAVVQIVPTRFSGATLSIQVVAPDSAKLQWNDSKIIIPVIQNSTGDSVYSPTLRFEYGPGDSTVMQCYVPSIQTPATLTPTQLGISHCPGTGFYGSPGLDQIIAARRGTAWVHANVTVFGVPLRDSVQYTLTNAMTGTVVLQPLNLALRFQQGQTVPIAPGGTVTFQNGFGPDFGASIQFVFDNPSAATAPAHLPSAGGTTGNITPLGSYQSTQRRFLTPGVYTWTATVIGGIPPYAGATTHGTVTVK